MFDVKTLASKEPVYTENGTGIFGKGALTRETQVQRSYQRMAKNWTTSATEPSETKLGHVLKS